MIKRTHVILGALAVLGGLAYADVKLGTPFADGMVLQRDMDVAVWGTDDAGRVVSVSFAGQTVETKADEQGRWSVKLPKLAASSEGRELVVTGSSTKIVYDVLVGEVWYCSGQSNTELPLVGNNPHFSDRQGRLVAQMTRKPQIRYAYASNYRWSVEPKATPDYPVVWKPFMPEHLGKPPSFSAMGVYFALELHAALGVPVGIVGSYWGGTNIDAWTPRCGYDGKDELKDVADWKTVPASGWKNELKHGPVGAGHQQPTVLWNEMVAPWCPMTMRGFIWYQGCHNNGEAERYCSKMHALYDGWAKSFANPDLKLYFVQLAPYNCSWWRLQLQQAKFAAEEKNAALVPTVDIGNGDDIHPSEKGTIGKRLAALALRHDYGFNDLVADAPVMTDICAEEGRLALRFANADGWYVYEPSWGTAGGFEVAGSDGVWKPASLVNVNGGKTERQPYKTLGTVEGRDLILESKAVEKPLKVRYLYNKPWTGNLFSSSGLPLGPFEAEVK